ncbi:flagellar M-ring protein FliF, partial [Gammaproteobacteria bacterium]|nr:flagellar M-ring protein FliF [Gammaproteobacteria bacterium]
DTILTDGDGMQGGAAGLTGVRSSQTTRNYEIDRTIQYEKKPTGIITRMSVAVVINEEAFGIKASGEDGEEAGVTADTIDTSRIQNLVASAVGFDQARGDSVAVLVSTFRAEELIENPMKWYENPMIFGFAKMGLIAFSFAVVVVFVVQPLIKSFAGPPPPPPASVEDLMLLDETISKEDVEDLELEGYETLEQIKAKLKPKKSSISADMLDTANSYDDKVALVRMLVGEDSGRVAKVLKKLVATTTTG